ncbi:MAG: hypothetical protein QOF00_5856 [Pseudonocardiales bacterium]|nr:hypothetical protein [Pseudonocardiales bacterium]
MVLAALIELTEWPTSPPVVAQVNACLARVQACSHDPHDVLAGLNARIDGGRLTSMREWLERKAAQAP